MATAAAEVGVGVAGGEAAEAVARRAVARRAAARAAQVGGPKLGRQVAQRASSAAMARSAARVATRTAARTGARVAAKAAMGPVGWAALGFDVLSMGLDVWDPFQFGTLMKNHDLRLMQEDFTKAYEQAYADAGVEFPQQVYPAFPEINDEGEFVDDALAKRHMELTMNRLRDQGYDLQDGGNTFEQPPLPGQPQVSFADMAAISTQAPSSRTTTPSPSASTAAPRARSQPSARAQLFEDADPAVLVGAVVTAGLVLGILI